MKTLQFILIALTAFAGCGSTTPGANKEKMNTKDSVTYLALGDSYTIGESVSQIESFPYQLTSMLKADAVKASDPYIIAVTGWTSDNLTDAINQSDIKGHTYNIVTLLIGVNDQYQGLSQDNYRTKFIGLVNIAIKFAGGNKNHVFVLSIPDYGVTPFAAGKGSIIGPQIDQFNSINKTESLKAGVNYVDITPVSRQAANDTSLIAPDGLHPSGKMYGEWVKLLGPQVLKSL